MQRISFPCRCARKLPILSALLLISLPAYAQGPAAGAPQDTPAQAIPFPETHIREQLIGELSPGAKLEGARSTQNHVAWIEKANGKAAVRLDGKPLGETWDDVNYLRFSADEQHLAFTAKRNSKWFLVLDGAVKSRPYGKLTAPVLSPNGKSFAVGACLEKKCRLIVNGDEIGPEFENISAPGFSSDGLHSVYFGKRNKKWIQVFDGRETGPDMDGFAFWYFAPDRQSVVVAARIGSDWTWIVNGSAGPAFDALGDIDFSPDGKHYAYGGTDAKWGFKKQKTRGVIVIDGKVAGTFEGRGFGGGWQGLFGTSQRMLRGPRRLFPDFHGVSDPRYTPAGKLVYAGRMSEGNVVVYIDGVPGPSFDDVVSPIGISADGNHIAYLGKHGDSFVEVRNQKLGPSFPAKRQLSFVGLLVISNDGAHLAYQIVRGGASYKQGRTTRALRRMVIDGRAGPEYDAHGIGHFAFTGDGRHHSYEVYGASGDRDRVVFDGMETRLYDSVFRRSTRFVDDTTIEFVARDGRRLLRIVATTK